MGLEYYRTFSARRRVVRMSLPVGKGDLGAFVATAADVVAVVEDAAVSRA